MQQKQRNRTSIEIIMISSDCTDLQRQCTHTHMHMCARDLCHSCDYTATEPACHPCVAKLLYHHGHHGEWLTPTPLLSTTTTPPSLFAVNSSDRCATRTVGTKVECLVDIRLKD